MQTLSKIILGSILALCFSPLSSQDLLDGLNDDQESTTTIVAATFKDTRIVNLQSNETPGKDVLHFVIAHRFGRLSDGAYELWGLDNASMRMGLTYGLSDRISVGIARSTFEKTFEATFKARIIHQTRGAREIPISLTWYSGIMCYGKKWELTEFSSRLSYVHQAIIARKFSRNLSLALVPSLIHRNLVSTSSDIHDQYVIGLGGRYKLSSRVSINGEYNYRINKSLEDELENGLSLGFDIETGGHVFQLHLTNSRGMFERSFLTETSGTWLAGDIYFGFNISRVFG
jgi:hypothetical protein